MRLHREEGPGHCSVSKKVFSERKKNARSFKNGTFMGRLKNSQMIRPSLPLTALKPESSTYEACEASLLTKADLRKDWNYDRGIAGCKVRKTRFLCHETR